VSSEPVSNDAVNTEKAVAERGPRKVRTGVVVSDAMDKTVMVRIDRQVRHQLYGKTVRRSSKLAAHDEANDAHVGDTVRVMETRPLSKSKRWRVVEVLERAK
jgi:small subunit ribosomal protein S17